LDLTKSFKCLDCKESFKAPEFRCKLTAKPHRIEEKKYYVEAAELTVHWKTEETYPVHEGSGKLITIQGRSSQANKGVIVSSDAEEQLFFDSYAGCITEDRWKEIFIPAEIRKEMTERENKRLEQVKNELLKEVERLKSEQEAARKAKAS
jgi:hypothetical protein